MAGNERVNQLAKATTKEGAEALVITEEGLKQPWKWIREEQLKRKVKGVGIGRVIKWNRKVRVTYIQCYTGKGNLQAWSHRIGKALTLNTRDVGNMRKQANT